MSEDAIGIVYLLGWLVTGIALVARDLRKGYSLFDGENIWWPFAIIVGWAWPVAAFAYLFVYLPAVAMNKVIK